MVSPDELFLAVLAYPGVLVAAAALLAALGDRRAVRKSGDNGAREIVTSHFVRKQVYLLVAQSLLAYRTTVVLLTQSPAAGFWLTTVRYISPFISLAILLANAAYLRMRARLAQYDSQPH